MNKLYKLSKTVEFMMDDGYLNILSPENTPQAYPLNLGNGLVLGLPLIISQK